MSKFPPAPFPSHLPAPPVLSSNPSAMDPLLEKSPSRSSRSSHSSHTSQSSHALDTSFDQQNLSSDDSAPAHNTADRLAYLNLTSPSGLTYEDYDSQEAFSHSDSRPYKESSWTRTFQTIIRGRAMPLRPLIFSILWAILAVVSSYFTRLGYRAHLNNECRWWCTPLAIDGDALSYVGFALFLLTSFRVQEYVFIT